MPSLADYLLDPNRRQLRSQFRQGPVPRPVQQLWQNVGESLYRDAERAWLTPDGKLKPSPAWGQRPVAQADADAATFRAAGAEANADRDARLASQATREASTASTAKQLRPPAQAPAQAPGLSGIASAHQMLDTPVGVLVQKYAPDRAGMVPDAIGKSTLRSVLQGPFGSMVMPQLQPTLAPQLKQWGITQQDFANAVNQPPPNPPAVIQAQPPQPAGPPAAAPPQRPAAAAPPRPPGSVPTGIPEGLHPSARGYAETLLKDFPGTPITSGHRDATTNAKVGGARGSQHIEGRALDISLRGLNDAQKAAVVDHALANGARGIGYYPHSESVHVDFREGANAAWGPNYSKTSLDRTPAWFQQRAQAHLSNTGGPAPPSGAVARARGPAPSTDMVMGKLQSLGFNEAQSKAIVGNMLQESSLRPNAVNRAEGAYGLMQWRGERFNQLQQFAQQQGTTWQNPDTQLAFIKHEMTNNPYEARQAQRFLQATTVEEANAGMRNYIRYGDGSEGKRLAYAQRVPGTAGTTAQEAIAQAMPGAQAAPVPSALSYGPTATPQAGPAPLQITVNKPSPPASPQQPQAVMAPRAQQNAPVSPAAPAQGRSKLAQQIMDSMLPHPSQGQLTTFVEPKTGNEIITGSIGGESIYRNLGRTGAGQPTTPGAVPAALRQAVEQAVPMPRPRPAEAPQGTPFAIMPDTGAAMKPPTVMQRDFSPLPTTKMPGELTPNAGFLAPGSLLSNKPQAADALSFERPYLSNPGAKGNPMVGPSGTPSMVPNKDALMGGQAPTLPGASFPGPRASPPGPVAGLTSPLPAGPPAPFPGPMSSPAPQPFLSAGGGGRVGGSGFNLPGPVSAFGPQNVMPGSSSSPAPQPPPQAWIPPQLQWWQQPGAFGGYSGYGGFGGGGYSGFGGFGSGDFGGSGFSGLGFGLGGFGGM